MTSKTKQNPERKEAILDSAERLFAENGFDNVSLRDIALDAGEEVTLVQYHFKKKDNLFKEAIRRRAKDFLQIRSEILDEMEFEASPNPLTVEQIVDAFIRPLTIVAESNELEWKHYLQLLLQASITPKWTELLNETLDQSARRIVVLLHRTLPDASKNTIFLCMHFIMSSVGSVFNSNQRINHLSEGQFDSSNLQAITQDTIVFISAGIRALAENKAD